MSALGTEVIRFDNVSKFYQVSSERPNVFRLALGARGETRRKDALTEVSFSVRRGECVGILGQNGAGKSTLLKLIANTLRPTSGVVTIGGRISAMLELGTGFNPARSGRDNVMTGGLCLGMTRAEIEERFDAIVAFAELGDWIDEPVRTYSTGMQMRLAFAVATAIEPDILIVDEAISVGDAKFQKKCFGRFEAMKAAGVTILIVTHWAQLVEMICDRGIYLVKGRIAADGAPKDVVAQYLEDLFGPLEAQLPAASEPQERRYGSGGVEIETVELLDEAGQALNTFRPGDRCSIRIGVACKQDEPVMGLNVGASITTKEGVRIFAINPQLTKQQIPTLARGDRLNVTIDLTLNLGVGDFFVTIGAWSPITEYHYDRRVDVRHIAVRGDFALTQSLVDLNGRYRIDLEAKAGA